MPNGSKATGVVCRLKLTTAKQDSIYLHSGVLPRAILGMANSPPLLTFLPFRLVNSLFESSGYRTYVPIASISDKRTDQAIGGLTPHYFKRAVTFMSSHLAKTSPCELGPPLVGVGVSVNIITSAFCRDIVWRQSYL